MVEIFTIGGGEYIVNVLNAVAAWTGAGGYKSLIQVAMVMGLAFSVFRRNADLHVLDGAAPRCPCH